MNECFCDARHSGSDEQLWLAAGAPSCYCWKLDAFDDLMRAAKSMEKAIKDATEGSSIKEKIAVINFRDLLKKWDCE